MILFLRGNAYNLVKTENHPELFLVVPAAPKEITQKLISDTIRLGGGIIVVCKTDFFKGSFIHYLNQTTKH